MRGLKAVASVPEVRIVQGLYWSEGPMWSRVDAFLIARLAARVADQISTHPGCGNQTTSLFWK